MRDLLSKIAAGVFAAALMFGAAVSAPPPAERPGPRIELRAPGLVLTLHVAPDGLHASWRRA